MLRARPTRALVVTAAIASTLFAAGCGGSAPVGGTSSPRGAAASTSASPTAEQPSMGELYTKVRAAALAAKSGHVSGTVTDSGEKVSLEIEGLTDGSNQEASFGVGSGRASVLTVDGKYFMSGDSSFWTEQTGDAAAAKALKGKYVAVSKADAKEMGDLSLGGLLKEMFQESELSALEKLTGSVETRTEGGGQVWVAADGTGSEMWVDPATGLPVKLLVAGKDAGELTFDRWNAAKTFTAPPASKVVTP